MLLVAEPCLGVDEKEALLEVIDSGWITMGARVRAFERAFAAQHRAEDAVAVSSCTAGLHLAIEAMGIGPGDEVLVPSLTFVATVNAIRYAGATPVFVDIESLDVPLVSSADAATKCGPRTKGAVVMHYAGYLCDGEAWTEFARARGLHLIEDAAHAAGLARDGTFGDVAVYSFFGNKNLTTAEGGMVIARDPAVHERIRQMRSHGMTIGTTERLSHRSITYDVTTAGYNYRMDDLRGAIGLVQLRNLSRWNQKREMLVGSYKRLLGEFCPEVAIPFSMPRATAHHIMPVILPEWADRSSVAERLREAGIQTSMHYPPVHEFSWYRQRFPSTSLPVTEEFGRRELTLPLHPKLEEADAEWVSRALSEALYR